MKSIFKIILVMPLLTLLLVSCDKNIDPINGDYQSGVLIINEGNFSASNGDITYYNSSTGINEPAIFRKVNGSFAGNVLQSLTLDGDVAYLVLNGDNKVQVVNSNTLKLTNTLSDELLVNPRYLQIVNGKAYISTWGSFDQNFSLSKSYLTVMDTKTLQRVDTIGTGVGVENLLYNGKYIFASDNNFGGSNTLSVIDPTTNTRIKKIQLANGPAGLVVDANNKLWIIATGTYTGNNGKIFRVNPSSFVIEQIIELGKKPNSDLAISPDKKSLYYSIGKQIYKMSIDATNAPTTSFINATDVVALYSFDVDPKSGNLYVGDALNYAVDGLAYIYQQDGSFKLKITTGINPTQFIFK
jgi:YVTN family beta-propeller protein